MKLKSLNLTVLGILTCIYCFGQTKYIMTQKGNIVDTLEYAKMKSDQADKMKNFFPTKDSKIEIEDNFKEIRRTRDSIIYSYNWETKINGSKIKISSSIKPYELIGKEFPLPILSTVDGKKISITDLKGKPTLVNFWFTTCKPCIEEMSVLNEIQRQFKDSVNFVAITFEPTEKVIAFLKNKEFSFIQIANAELFTESMKITAYPANIFLDKNGIIRKKEAGIPYIYKINDDKQPKMGMGDGKAFIDALRKLL